MTPLPQAEPPRLRIAFLCESGTDVRLVEGLARHAHVHVLLRSAFGPRTLNWPVAPELPVELLPAPPGRLAFAAHCARWLARHGRGLDAVLAQNAGLAALAANTARPAHRAPVLVLVCSPNRAYLRTRRTRGELGLVRWAAADAALASLAWANGAAGARYVALSRYLAGQLGGWRAGGDVIPLYGVDPAVFHPVAPDERARARAALGLAPEAFVLFFSSRVAPEKDTESVVEAVRLLAAEGRRVRLVNRSGGYRELLALAEAAGVRAHVDASDAVHPTRELPTYYRAADLCVQASREEGLGFSPLEALACGTPVVATAVGGLRETVREGETGYTFPAGDARALARQVARAMDAPSEAAALAARGRAEVLAHYDAAAAFAALARRVEALRSRT